MIVPSAPVLASALALLSILLAAPLSSLLARACWTRRAPRAALMLWQAVCLAAGLCMIGAGFVLALEPLGHNIPTALSVWLRRLFRGDVLAGMTGRGIVIGTLATSATVVLFAMLVRSMLLTLARRRAHRRVLDLLTAARTTSGPHPDHATVATPTPPLTPGSVRRDSLGGEIGDLLTDVRILDHSTAVAYTLPGWHSRVVLSAGLLNLLGRPELVAVIDHEMAHVRSRHDLLVLPFQAWETALGWLPGVRAAAGSVAELTEMLADDWAARRSGPTTLARALATVALAGVQAGEAGAGSLTPAVAGRSVAARVDRLLRPSPLPLWWLICVYLTAALLLAGPATALLIGWS